jgi:hypothetical protein
MIISDNGQNILEYFWNYNTVKRHNVKCGRSWKDFEGSICDVFWSTLLVFVLRYLHNPPAALNRTVNFMIV